MSRRRYALKCEGKAVFFSLLGNLFSLPGVVEVFLGKIPENYIPNIVLYLRHFSEESYINLYAYNAAFVARLLLKDGSIPSLFGPACSSSLVHCNKCRSWTELKNSRCLEILAEKTGGGLLYFIIGSLFSPSFSSQSFYLQDSSNPNTKGVKSESLMLQTPTTVYERKSACRGKAISYPHSVKASDPSKQTNKLAFEPDVRGQSESLIFHPVLCIGRFFDNMSFVDACLQKPSLNRNELCKTEALGWMGAKLKDSLLDFQREEQIRQNFENCSQLLAFVEVLSFHCCQTELSGIWTETARLRENMSSERWEQMMAFFSQPFGQKQLPTCYCKFCEPRAAQKHRELASMLISSRKICCLRNKRAFFMDYLPTLRSICRSERVKGQHSIRHSHYLSSFHLPRSTLELMALDFP